VNRKTKKRKEGRMEQEGRRDEGISKEVIKKEDREE
jgi:hypothetical protein